MFELIKADYARAFERSGYKGAARRHLHTLTAAGFQAAACYRAARWLMLKRVPFLGAVIQRLAEVWTGVSIPPEAAIGPGLWIPHGDGIVVNGRAEIGRDCTLHHQVTVGNKNPGGPSPKIGDRVMIGAGARVLGGIRVGDGAQIGANAVVLQDVPANAAAVGIPARIVPAGSKEFRAAEAGHESD
jgi:serine O-acetyltransferase